MTVVAFSVHNTVVCLQIRVFSIDFDCHFTTVLPSNGLHCDNMLLMLVIMSLLDSMN